MNVGQTIDNMANRIKRLILYISLVTFGIGIGYMLNIPIGGTGGGQIISSPNGKWQAIASTVNNSKLFGDEHRFYELAINTVPPNPMSFRVVTT